MKILILTCIVAVVLINSSNADMFFCAVGRAKKAITKKFLKKYFSATRKSRFNYLG